MAGRCHPVLRADDFGLAPYAPHPTDSASYREESPRHIDPFSIARQNHDALL